MAATLKHIGSGKDFSTHLAYRDWLNSTYSGDLTGQGIQTFHTHAGGTANIYDEQVNWSGITCTASDYIHGINQNTFLNGGVATYRHGTVLRSNVNLYVHWLAEHMILDGYNINHEGNCTWGYGGITPNNDSIVKNCFISAQAKGPGGAHAFGLAYQNKTNIIVANCVFLKIGGNDYSIGVHAYLTTGSSTLKIYHCEFIDLFAANSPARNHIRAQGNSNLHVYIYNTYLDKPKSYITNKAVREHNGTEDVRCYNVCTEDGTADDYGGSGNIVNKDPWKDCYLLGNIPAFIKTASVLYQAGYNLDSDPNKAHFQYDIHGNLRDLTQPSIGASEYMNIGLPDVTAPGVATDLTLTNGDQTGTLTGDKITLRWTDPSGISSGGCNVYLATAVGGPYVKNNVSLISPGTQLYEFSGLQDKQRYWARVTGVGSNTVEGQPSDMVTTVCRSTLQSYINELLEAIRLKLADITTGNGYFHTLLAANIIVGDLGDLEHDRMLKNPSTSYPWVEILVDAGKGEGPVSQRDIQEDIRFEFYAYTYAAVPSRTDGDDMKDLVNFCQDIKTALFSFHDDPPVQVSDKFLQVLRDHDFEFYYQPFSEKINMAVLRIGFQMETKDTEA
jgi:hypothetical protein